MLGAGRTASMHAVVDDYCDDAEINSIKTASKNRGLYLWGVVTYEDVFGDKHYTRFCQHLTWLPDDKVFAYFTPGHNDAD